MISQGDILGKPARKNNKPHLFTSDDLFQTHRMKFKTLLIDLDGTILGTHSSRLNILFTFNFVKCLRQYGFSTIKSLKVLHLLKLSMREPTHQKNGVLNWTKATNFFSQLSGRSFDESESILTKTARICFEKSSSALYAKSHAIDFILWAKNHYNLILATNPLWPLDVVTYRLGIAKIHESEFEFITHAGNMSSSKPHIDYYQELQALRNLSPESCLMIGNDEKKDGPARKIGIEVFLINQDEDFLALRQLLENDQERAIP